MSAPRIGVSGVVRNWDGAERTGVNAAYVRSVLAAGGVPVILSPLLGPSFAARALDGLDGLLLSGGEDIHPAWYGAAAVAPPLSAEPRARPLRARRSSPPRASASSPSSASAAAFSSSTSRSAVRSSRTCRGAADIAEHDRHDRATCARMRVRLAGGTRRRSPRARDPEREFLPSSGIRRLAAGSARQRWSEDGLVEAVESPAEGPGCCGAVAPGGNASAMPKAPERGLFRALVEAVPAY